MNVKGTTYQFRKGEDGRLRRIGNLDGDPEDAKYARRLIQVQQDN